VLILVRYRDMGLVRSRGMVLLLLLVRRGCPELIEGYGFGIRELVQRHFGLELV
jgi:hypothetical protein